MSTLREPVGPERKSTYVRRRLIVLGVFVAFLIFVVLVIVKPGANQEAAKAPEVAVPEDLVASEAADSETNSGLPACASGELEVTAITNASSYAAGVLPQLSLSVKSVADVACHADLGTATMTFMVTSGSDEVWRSADCQEYPDSRQVILSPDEELMTEPLEWDRTRSNPDTCGAERDQVSAGGATYHLHVSIAGVSSADTASFLLY